MTSPSNPKPCSYCGGIGSVYGGGAYAPRRRCLICKGSGLRIEAEPFEVVAELSYSAETDELEVI